MVAHRQIFTAWKVSKYWVFSGPYFPVFVLIRVFNDYASQNPFFWNWYILIIEFIEVIFL